MQARLYPAVRRPVHDALTSLEDPFSVCQALLVTWQDAGAAAAWFPALTTMAGLQANWDFLSDFQQRGTLALDALRAQAVRVPGVSPAMAAFWTSRVCAPWRRCIFQTKAERPCPGLSAARPGRLRRAWRTRCGSY